jgi:hypothetical protein
MSVVGAGDPGGVDCAAVGANVAAAQVSNVDAASMDDVTCAVHGKLVGIRAEGAVGSVEEVVGGTH